MSFFGVFEDLRVQPQTSSQPAQGTRHPAIVGERGNDGLAARRIPDACGFVFTGRYHLAAMVAEGRIKNRSVVP
jgi:hypothetical protein